MDAMHGVTVLVLIFVPSTLQVLLAAVCVLSTTRLLHVTALVPKHAKVKRETHALFV
jgi:hypothetical protein